MKEKKCFKCGEVKPLSEFYKHPEMSDGHVNKCKECNKRDVYENKKKLEGFYKAYDRNRPNKLEEEDARILAETKKGNRWDNDTNSI